MSKLSAALEWARRGFSVFPLQENSKEPVSVGWEEMATQDPVVIRAMWTDPVLRIEKDYNVGCLCTDMVVVDIDVKNGKDGYNDFLQLGGSFDTLVVQTPSGGYHCYYQGPDSSNASLTHSVDIRSHNGLTVAPGSIIDGVAYQIVADREMTWVPLTIERQLRPPYIRSEVAGLVGLDAEVSIEAARRFLESAPPAVEGMRGDETTFTTAARLVRELALSVPTAFHLMRDHWNDRCSPPWELSELLAKVENAAAYGSADLGRLTAETLFGHLNIPPPPTLFQQIGDPWGNATQPHNIQPRPWLVERALMTQNVTVLLAAGSAGKSSISLALAAHLALGLDFAGYKTRKACKSIIYNGEDDVQEQSRRLLAVCLTYGFDYQEVKKNIMLLSQREIKMDLVSKEFYKPVRNQILVDQLTAQASMPDVGLVILDPLVKIHKCDESDNGQMDYVMETLTDMAHQANVAVLVLHHTSKGGGTQENRIGNMDIGRGASAIINAARIAFTLLGASQQDAEDYGLTDEERMMWVRLDDAKMNLTLSNNRATWFKKHGVKIPSNDLVGVLRHEVLEKSQNHLRGRVANIIIGTLMANGTASMTLGTAVTTVKSNEPLLANKTDTELRKRIEGMFTVPFEVDGKTLQAKRESDKANGILITMI